MHKKADNPFAHNAFREWRVALGGIDLNTAAKLLGKSRRIIGYYDVGIVPPIETRKMMTLIAERGPVDVKPWDDTSIPNPTIRHTG